MTENTYVARWERAIANPVTAYVLVRVDTPGLPSVGRLGAQTHHCGTQLTEEKIAKNFPDLNDLYEEWQRDPALEIAAENAMAAFNAVKDNDPAFSEIKEAADAACKAAARAERSFGTVLTMAVTAAQMRQTVSLAQLMGFHAGITHDPTFPIFLRDGEKTIVTVAPVDSCAYVFGRKSDLAPLVGQFDLLSERHL